MCNIHLNCPLGTVWLAHGHGIAVFWCFGFCKQRRAKTTAWNYSKSSSLYLPQYVDEIAVFWRFGLCKQRKARILIVFWMGCPWADLFHVNAGRSLDHLVTLGAIIRHVVPKTELYRCALYWCSTVVRYVDGPIRGILF